MKSSYTTDPAAGTGRIKASRQEVRGIIRDAVSHLATLITITYDDGDFPSITRAQEIIRWEARWAIDSVEKKYKKYINNTSIYVCSRYGTKRDKEHDRTIIVWIRWDPKIIDWQEGKENAESN